MWKGLTTNSKYLNYVLFTYFWIPNELGYTNEMSESGQKDWGYTGRKLSAILSYVGERREKKSKDGRARGNNKDGVGLLPPPHQCWPNNPRLYL